MPPFSRRIPEILEDNPLTLALRRLGPGGYLDLTVSNPTRVGLAYPDEGIAAAMDAATRLGRYDPAPQGALAAREAVAAYLYDAQGVAISPERLFLTASSSEAYGFLFKLLCDPGDAVLAPSPSYPLFEHLAALDGVRLYPYPLRFAGGWALDGGDLAQAVARHRPKAIIAVSPNNPTGSYLKADEAAQLMDHARDGALIVDEVFADFPLEPDPGQAASVLAGPPGEGLAFGLGGLSKCLGLPHLKLGWIAVTGPDALALEACARLEVINDTYLSAAGPVQAALPDLLALRGGIQREIRGRLGANLASLRSALQGDPWVRCLPVEGGWSACLRLPQGLKDPDVAGRLLEEAGVFAHPGHFFDLPDDLLVVSLLSPPDRFAEGLARIRAFAAREMTAWAP